MWLFNNKEKKKMHGKCGVCGLEGEDTFEKFDETGSIIKSGSREKLTLWICSTCKASDDRAKVGVARGRARHRKGEPDAGGERPGVAQHQCRF